MSPPACFRFGVVMYESEEGEEESDERLEPQTTIITARPLKSRFFGRRANFTSLSFCYLTGESLI